MVHFVILKSFSCKSRSNIKQFRFRAYRQHKLRTNVLTMNTPSDEMQSSANSIGFRLTYMLNEIKLISRQILLLSPSVSVVYNQKLSVLTSSNFIKRTNINIKSNLSPYSL